MVEKTQMRRKMGFRLGILSLLSFYNQSGFADHNSKFSLLVLS